MKWSNFTLNNYKKISKCDIIENDFFIKKMNDDKDKIIKLNDVNFDLSYTNIDYELINKKSSTKWVYSYGLKKDLINLKSEIVIKWNNNIMYIKCNEDKLVKILNRLPTLLKMMNYINNNEKHLKIYLILSNLKKDIDFSKNLEAKQINSGYSDIRDKYIFIWREEEFEKLLFHELIHLLDKDHRDEIYDLDRYNDKSFYEALTDTKAIYYNLIYLSILTKYDIQNLLTIELSFIINQANFMNDLLNKKYKEISGVTSYYILKSKIFKYILSNKMNDELYKKIFILNTCGNDLINIIYKNDLHIIPFVYLKSARMTILELN